MVEKVKKPLSEYAKRLAHALSPDVAGITPVELANQLELSRQAIEKFFRGESDEMKAANHIKTSRILGIDPAWLALGEGVPRPGDFQVQWHERLLLEQFRELPPEDQNDIADLLRSKLELVRQHAGRGSADPFAGRMPPKARGTIVNDTGAPPTATKTRKAK